MPKRSSDEDSDEYIRRKMRKIEKKLRKRKKRSRRASSNSNSSRTNNVSPVPSLLEDGQEHLLAEPVGHNEQLGLPTQDGDLEICENQPGPSASATSASAAPEECPLDPHILEMLGATPTKSKKMGANIQKDVALRWEHIATSGLIKDNRKDLLDRHLIPENCPKIAAPILNPEVKAALSDTMIGKDKGTEHKQNQIASAISCIGEALTKMLDSEIKDPDIVRPLLDGAQLLCDLQYCESMKRRSLICASIKKEIKTQLYETEIDTYLFGEKLADTLRAAKAINKSGSEIRVSKPKSSAVRVQARSLNSKPQPANSRQPVKRRPEPAAYIPTYTTPVPAGPRRQYQLQAPQSVPHLLPPPPPPPPPPQPLQQRYRQPRPHQRR